jgi:hypothetical protein
MSKATTQYPLPPAGRGRFWHGVHNAGNVKFPMTLELRESSIDIGDREPRASFSRLIAKQPVIADPKAIAEAAKDILVRAARVDEFVGILS